MHLVATATTLSQQEISIQLCDICLLLETLQVWIFIDNSTMMLVLQWKFGMLDCGNSLYLFFTMIQKIHYLSTTPFNLKFYQAAFLCIMFQWKCMMHRCAQRPELPRVQKDFAAKLGFKFAMLSFWRCYPFFRCCFVYIKYAVYERC